MLLIGDASGGLTFLNTDTNQVFKRIQVGAPVTDLIPGFIAAGMIFPLSKMVLGPPIDPELPPDCLVRVGDKLWVTNKMLLRSYNLETKEVEDPVAVDGIIRGIIGGDNLYIITDKGIKVGASIIEVDAVGGIIEKDRLYTFNRSVSMIDLETNTVMSTIFVGRKPIDLAYDTYHERLYTLTDSALISGDIIIPIRWGARKMVYDPVHRRIYIVNGASVDVVDTDNNKVVMNVPLRPENYTALSFLSGSVGTTP
jgi:YVTN family beta-propeller protein